ncbi:MAG: glycosyltransferase [Bacillota bacterium]|nr:glycosyltransferase [Bacillota bacterium]
MRIVLVSPNLIPLPGSGGIERVVYNLSDELVNRGHEVYVYAQHDSNSRAMIIPYGYRGFKKNNIKEFVLETLPDGIDIIHDHTHDLVIGREKLAIPTISTIHTEFGLNFSVKCPVYVSQTKLKQSTNKHIGAYVHNGIDVQSFTYSEVKDNYLLFLGRIDQGKGVEDVIQLGKQTGMQTVLAGPEWDKELYRKMVSQISEAPNIKYVGEVHGKAKQDLLKNAKWLVFPIENEEQFGLVLIEALACGTPVAAYNKGAVPEILQGLPMFVCRDLHHMKQLVLGDSPVKPKDLRSYVVDRFTKEKMTDSYLKLYQRAMHGWKQ